jgi:hypothetical protein
MIILGLNTYHGDSSACLIKDGVLIAAAEEERFTRIKGDASFPHHAIGWCLDHAGIDLMGDHVHGVDGHPAAIIEVNGNPVVRVWDDGRPVTVEVRQGSDQLHDPGPSPIVVAPGGAVQAGMLWRLRVESENPDDIVDATELSVSYADHAPLQLVEPEYSIDLGTTRTLEVTAWR